MLPRLSQIFGDKACHPERSEGSSSTKGEILPLRYAQGFGSCAQNDSQDSSHVRSRDVLSPNI